jgi:hypothetical protein
MVKVPFYELSNPDLLRLARKRTVTSFLRHERDGMTILVAWGNNNTADHAWRACLRSVEAAAHNAVSLLRRGVANSLTAVVFSL